MQSNTEHIGMQRHYLFRPQIITVTGTSDEPHKVHHILDNTLYRIHANDNQVMQGCKTDALRWLNIYERLNATGDLAYFSTQNDTYDGDIKPVHLTYADVIYILSQVPNAVAKNRNWPDELYTGAWLKKSDNGKLILTNVSGEPIAIPAKAMHTDLLHPNLEEDSWFVSIIKEEQHGCCESC